MTFSASGQAVRALILTFFFGLFMFMFNVFVQPYYDRPKINPYFVLLYLGHVNTTLPIPLF